MTKKLSTREEFLEKAAPYYAVAIAKFFEWKGGSTTAYTKEGITQDTDISFSENEIFERAIQICIEAGLVELHQDDFGPKSYSPCKETRAAVSKLQTMYDVFAKYERQADGHAWLVHALRSMHSRWQSVQYLPADQKVLDVWQPIPIERDDPKFKEAVAAVDRAVEAVRADNGYAATHPEERRYILDHLVASVRRLREDAQIGWKYLKEFTLEPLGILIKRFGKAATGLAATEARTALLKWLRDRLGDLLNQLLN